MEKHNPKCYFCSTSNSLSEVEAHTDSGILYTLNQCSVCGVQYWTPFKNPGAEWYERDERYKNANEDSVPEPTWSHKKTLDFLLPLKGRVFDVGCGTGNFLRWAKLHGWDVAGIDFDSNAIYSAQTKFLLPNIELATLGDYVDKYKDQNLKYDLVTFFDVFEHIDNHNDFLDQVRGLLKPRSYVAMSMPYRRGSRWLQPNDLPPRHLTRWDEKSLKNFLEHKGFSMKYVKRIPAPIFYIVMKLRFKYGSIFSFGLVNKVRKGQVLETKTNNVNQKPKKEVQKVRIIHGLAKIKDVLIFGLPALLIWLYLLPSAKRYTGLFAIAQKDE